MTLFKYKSFLFITEGKILLNKLPKINKGDMNKTNRIEFKSGILFIKKYK